MLGDDLIFAVSDHLHNPVFYPFRNPSAAIFTVIRQRANPLVKDKTNCALFDLFLFLQQYIYLCLASHCHDPGA